MSTIKEEDWWGIYISHVVYPMLAPVPAFLPCLPHPSLLSPLSYRCFNTAFLPYKRLQALTRYPECLLAGAAAPTMES